MMTHEDGEHLIEIKVGWKNVLPFMKCYELAKAKNMTKGEYVASVLKEHILAQKDSNDKSCPTCGSMRVLGFSLDSDYGYKINGDEHYKEDDDDRSIELAEALCLDCYRMWKPEWL